MSRKKAVLQAVIDAWCERQDIDEVLSHMTDDIVWHFSAVSVPPKTGKSGAREFLTAMAVSKSKEAQYKAKAEAEAMAREEKMKRLNNAKELLLKSVQAVVVGGVFIRQPLHTCNQLPVCLPRPC